MSGEDLLPGPDHRTDNIYYIKSEQRKQEIIDKITCLLKPLEKRIVERLLSETQLCERLEEYIDVFHDDEGARFTGINTSQIAQLIDSDLESRRMKYRYDVNKVLMGNKLGTILQTVLHTLSGDDVIRRILLEEGGSCLEASIAAAFLIQVNVKTDAKILGWNSSASGLHRRAHRALLHEHYCVVYTADTGETMFMLHDGLTFSLDLCQQCVLATGERQDTLLRKLLRAQDEGPLPEEAKAEVKRLKRILDAYNNVVEKST